MNTQLVTHIFASLQSLEKCFSNTKKMISGREESFQEISKLLPEQERILEQMRRVANKLQLETARNDWATAVRSMKIFYGLNHMVRNDIMSAFATLTQQHTIQFAKSVAAGKEIVYH